MKGKDEKDFSRRVHLILSASLTAGLVLSAGMTAMAYTPGTYTASAKGMESDVTVTLTVTEDGIEKADIDSSGETPSIGAAAEETLEQQVMDAQSADIDGIAGATVTSTAVRTALKDCLQQAGGAEDAKEDETEAASSEKDTAETAGKQSGARVAKTNTGITVTKAEDWAEEYPDIYKSYMKNEENSEQTDYLEEYPYLKTLYEGYGFAIQYDSARGHSYVIDDVTSTGRPHKLYLNVIKPTRRVHITAFDNHVTHAYLVETGEDLEFQIGGPTSPTGHITVKIPEEYKTKAFYTIGLDIEEETLVNKDLDW